MCTHSPRLTSIKQNAVTGFVYIDFGMFLQPAVGAHIFCEPGECHGGFPNSLIEPTVNGAMEKLSVMLDLRNTNL